MPSAGFQTAVPTSEKWQTKAKGKDLPIQAWRDPYGFRMCRLPEFLENWYMNVEGLSPLCVAPFTSRRHHWHSFLSEADSTKLRDFPAATQCLNHLRHGLPHSQYPYAQNLSSVGLP